MNTELSSVARDLRRFFVESLNGVVAQETRPSAVTGAGSRQSPSSRHPAFAPDCPADAGPHPTLDLTASARNRADDERFNHLGIRLFQLQYSQNKPYRLLCEARGVTSPNVVSWKEIPAVTTSAFKEFTFSALPESERMMYFESSGTTRSVRSRSEHSPNSLELYKASLLPWFQHHVLPETLNRREAIPGPQWDFLSLTPPLSHAPHSSLVYMLEAVSGQGWFQNGGFVGKVNERGSWSLDLDACLATLREACRQQRPLTLTGTAFNYVHLLDALDATSLQLPPKSRIMETGGYKGRSRALSKTDLHAELALRLGVSPGHIVTEYGMTELGSQAYDHAVGAEISARRLRFPPWTRATVVSCETGLEAAEGEPGLVRIVDLANAFSVVAVETEDLAICHPDGIELLGRREQAEPRGCSLMAT